MQDGPIGCHEDVVKYLSSKKYNDALLTVPMYLTIYFDFYTSQIQNYYITAHITWVQTILKSLF